MFILLPTLSFYIDLSVFSQCLNQFSSLLRYARADAAKRLLDAGAEANAQDNTGRTPLHAAVAADAMGVFQVRYCFLPV